MINPMTTFFASIKAKLYQMTNGIKRYLNPRYLARLVNVQIKKMTQALFNIKPASKEDYYTLGRWAVSKKLAILIVVLVNMVCIMLVMNLLPPQTGMADGTGQKLPSYRYTSLRLYGYDGTAQVLSSDGKVIYRGSLSGGMAKGEGTLYGLDGIRVYTGDFDRNMYNGKGTLYSPNGNPIYSGDFVDNLYSGTGKLFYPGNMPQYEGEFVASMRNGVGKTYSEDGRIVYEGQFIMDRIDFLRFLGMPSTDLGCYKGKSRLFEGDYTTAVLYDDFGLVYEMEPNKDDPTISSIIRCYVVGSAIDSTEKAMTAAQLIERYKVPAYRGSAPLASADYAALELFMESSDTEAGDIARKRYPFAVEETTGGIYTVLPQSSDTIYIETYQDGEYAYTYYFLDEQETYSFYSVEKAQAKNGQ